MAKLSSGQLMLTWLAIHRLVSLDPWLVWFYIHIDLERRFCCKCGICFVVLDLEEKHVVDVIIQMDIVSDLGGIK
jgi:hypothetical protein